MTHRAAERKLGENKSANEMMRRRRPNVAGWVSTDLVGVSLASLTYLIRETPEKKRWRCGRHTRGFGLQKSLFVDGWMPTDMMKGFGRQKMQCNERIWLWTVSLIGWWLDAD